MKRLSKKISQFNVFILSTIFFSFSFGLGIAINSIGFFLFCITGFVFCVKDFKSQNGTFKMVPLVALSITYFFFIFFREFLINFKTAPEIIVEYIAFLLIPGIVLLQSNNLKTHIPTVLRAFLAGMLLNAMVNLGFGIYRGFIIKEEGINFWYFTYNFLSEPFGIQPIYLGFFYVIAVMILLQYKSKFKNPFCFYSCLALLVISVFLLAARNAILCLVFLVPTYLFLSKKIGLKSGLWLIGILIVSFIVALQNPVVKNRIFKAAEKGNFYSGSSLRLNIWQSSIQASKKNFIWGAGHEKTELLLLNEYGKRDLTTPLKYKYHTHNQFLQTLVQYGVVGLMILALFLIAAIGRTWNERNYLGVIIIVLFIFSMMTESIFTRQWGVLSFLFFISLLAMKMRPN